MSLGQISSVLSSAIIQGTEPLVTESIRISRFRSKPFFSVVGQVNFQGWQLESGSLIVVQGSHKCNLQDDAPCDSSNVVRTKIEFSRSKTSNKVDVKHTVYLQPESPYKVDVKHNGSKQGLVQLYKEVQKELNMNGDILTKHIPNRLRAYKLILEALYHVIPEGDR